VDGREFADIEAHGLQRWLSELPLALRQETCRADPITRVSIPKVNGEPRRAAAAFDGTDTRLKPDTQIAGEFDPGRSPPGSRFRHGPITTWRSRSQTVNTRIIAFATLGLEVREGWSPGEG
jgi:hypothetical protein